MPHLDRLRPLRYVSPSGAEFRPLWDSLERSGGKKTGIHEFPHQDKALVQDLGNNAERFPLSLYFAGPDYDQIADAFYTALRERGAANIRHPRWGDKRVIPLTWSQTEDHVGDLHAARFDVELIEAPDLALSGTADTAAAIQAASDASAAAASATTAAQVSAQDASDLARMKDKVVKRVRATVRELSQVTATIEQTRQEIEGAGRKIERTIDALIQTPLTLCQSVVSLARAPARAVTGIGRKVQGYSTLIADASAALGQTTVGEAALAAIDLIANIIALLESVTEGTLSSRDDAVNTSDTARAAADAALDGLDNLERTAIGYVTDPALLALIAQLRAQALALLVSETYELPAERTIILDHEWTPLDLSFRFYGTIDDIDRLISDNAISGDELFVLPRGRSIRYYA